MIKKKEAAKMIIANGSCIGIAELQCEGSCPFHIGGKFCLSSMDSADAFMAERKAKKAEAAKKRKAVPFKVGDFVTVRKNPKHHAETDRVHFMRDYMREMIGKKCLISIISGESIVVDGRYFAPDALKHWKE